MVEIVLKSADGKTITIDGGNEDEPPDDTAKLEADFLSYTQSGLPAGGQYRMLNGGEIATITIKFENVALIVSRP